MNMKKMIAVGLAWMSILSADAAVSLVHTDEHWATSFENGAIAPYYECTFKRPAYINAVDLDGRMCAKVWWSAENYDGSRLDRGMEACSGDSTTELRFLEDGWYGLNIYFPSDAYPTNKNCIVLQLFAHGRGGSWAGTLIVNDNRLSFEHRYALVSPTVVELDGDIPRDTWIPIVIYWKPSDNPDNGRIKVWYNGAPEALPTYDYTGKFAFDDAWNGDTMTSGIGLKWGMYCADSDNYTLNETRTIYYDDVSQLKGNPVGAWDLVNPADDAGLPDGIELERIQAESHADRYGTQLEGCTDVGGGSNVSYISNNDWCRYDNLTLGTGTVFRARVARPNNKPDGRIEIRLDGSSGPLVGTVDVPETEGWQNWVTVETALSDVAGTHSVYLKFVEVDGTTGTSLFNINWFALVLHKSPVGLMATPVSAAQIDLSWSGMSSATAYNLKRSFVSGGPYSNLVSGVSTNFSDTGLLGGSAFYYVVSAEYTGVESGDSAEVHAVSSDPIVPEEVVVGPVVIDDDGAGGSVFKLSVPDSGLGHAYQVKVSGSLVDPNWVDVGDAFPGTGSNVVIEIPMDPAISNLFYQLAAWRQ